MFKKLMKGILGDPVERALDDYRRIAEKIKEYEPALKKLSDDALRAKTDEFRARLAQGELLDDIAPEAFAAVREATIRAIGMRQYDVQMIGGQVLHQGRIAEMKTGEGKTLVASLPLYLNALNGKGAHLITPNDYLSKYGLQVTGPIYHFLGLSAAVIQNTGGDPNTGSYLYDPDYNSDDDRYQHLRPITRRQAYDADITYGTNNEFGFDYLRDNMALSDNDLVQVRGLHYAIVDEVDSILIDEARTPLIISGQADEPSDNYARFAAIVKKLKPSSQASIDAEDPDGDYVVEIKDRISYLTEAGVEKIENILGIDELFHADNADLIPYVDNCLRAHALYHRDKEYVVQDGQIIIVDEFTGRLMIGRRFSEGLHQAIEAKEGVEIRRENLTLATITFQNFFRMYDKLAGMTGTALTESEEFEKIYNLEVIPIPTNLPIVRRDLEDLIYATEEAKFDALVKDIAEKHARQQPVLVGTVAIETSERLGKALKKAGIPHEILNAKQHEREATIITQAGRPGAVTIATNMAGRGVDILLGGNPEGLAREILRKQNIDLTEATEDQWKEALARAQTETEASRQIVLEAGGLYVLGTERHEARRIDNQLRGRAGRQGDPGVTRFMLSLEDDLVRRFGGDRIKNFMSWANIPENEPIEHGMISRAIGQAQVRVEGYNFDVRKRVLEYDDVVNRQREFIYKQRREILTSTDLSERYLKLLNEAVVRVIDEFAPEGSSSRDWDLTAMHQKLFTIFPVPEHLNPDGLAEMENLDTLEETLLDAAHKAFVLKMEGFAEYKLRAQVFVMIRAIDMHWQRHLTDLDVLREGIGLQSVAQRDPLVEYKREAFIMFDEMQTHIAEQATQEIFRVQINRVQQQPQRRNMIAHRPGATEPERREPARAQNKLGRNDPCHCGSGKKYKQCHMKADQGRAAG